jgi:hypothetical protein
LDGHCVVGLEYGEWEEEKLVVNIWDDAGDEVV